MRVPNFGSSPTLMQRIGIFLCGFVIGCAVMTAVAQKSVQDLQNNLDTLEDQNRTLTEEIDSYEKVKDQRNVIAKMTVRWDEGQKDFGKSTMSELKERIGTDLKLLVGKPVHADIFSVYRSLIDGKIYYDVNDKDYRVHLQMLSVISTEGIVFVRAEEFIAN